MAAPGCPTFEQGPIRPPSEARSLLVRVVRNCPWNRCAFCPVYKGSRFSKRSREEILADLEAVRRTLDTVSPDLARADGRKARRLVHEHRKREGAVGPGLRALLPWVHGGQETAFLQDADALVAPVEDVEAVLDAIGELFPRIQRITTYARCQTLVHRSVADLERLARAGLTRVHVGLESGSDEVLALVKKGATAERLLEAGRRVKAAGLSLCLYVMPGLGGQALSNEHAHATGALVAKIDPDHVRLRTLAPIPGTALAEAFSEGRFEPLGEVATVREIRAFLGELTSASGRLVSDHVLNLLQELEGKLPEELPAMMATTDRFLSLAEDSQRAFIIGRRLGYLRGLDDLEDEDLRSSLITMAADVAPGGSMRDFDEAMVRLRTRFV